MVDKPESSNHEEEAPDKPPQPPGEEVALTPEPPGIVQQETSQEKQHEPPEHCQPVLPPRRKRPRDCVDYLTLFLAAVAILVYGWQARTLSRQAAALNATVGLMENAQRAWVGAIPPVGVETAEPGLTVTVGLKNFGQSPALHVAHNLHLRTQPCDQPFIPDAPPAKEPGSRGVLQPGQALAAVIVADPRFIEQMPDIKLGSTSLYVFGEVTYGDIFGEHRETRFAYVLRPDLSAWEVLDAYNSAD